MLLTVENGGTQRVRDETPAGLINGVNTVYTTGNKFVAGSETVYFNGQRLVEGATNDYVRSESGGLGNGYDTITLVVPPRARSGPKSDDITKIDYNLG